jgi:hypothetical protein
MTGVVVGHGFGDKLAEGFACLTAAVGAVAGFGEKRSGDDADESADE